jgi:hypothetical protein
VEIVDKISKKAARNLRNKPIEIAGKIVRKRRSKKSVENVNKMSKRGLASFEINLESAGKLLIIQR